MLTLDGDSIDNLDCKAGDVVTVEVTGKVVNVGSEGLKIEVESANFASSGETDQEPEGDAEEGGEGADAAPSGNKALKAIMDDKG